MRRFVSAVVCVAAFAIPAGAEYWAFEPIANPAAPESDSVWVRTAVDSFILAKLDEEGIQPSPPLENERLVRRVYLDLTGLPPTPEQSREFLDDPSPRAYADLVERLLESPHYGERWALKWLDVVRYSDTDGFERDGYRTDAWRYRDYVVAAFNSDKPYDRCVQEQIAGDELFPGNSAALTATGFNRIGPRHVVGGNQDKAESRQEVLTEMTYGVGAVLLGLTVQCAQCHDHKFDPIPQADYYRLQAFFAATDLAEPNVAPHDQVKSYEDAVESHKQRLLPIKAKLKEIEDPYRDQVRVRKIAELDPAFRQALETSEDHRTDEQERLAEEAEDQVKPFWYEMLALIPSDVKARRAELRRQMHAINLESPDPAPAALAVSNMTEAPATHILKVGDYRHKQDRVEPGFPTAVGDHGIEVPTTPEGRRAALAKWLSSPANPLTARVMANRIWEFRMGRGLVSDPNNFGALGGSPSHPELLDYLASKFIDTGWSVKSLDRMIVLSSAYRQSAAIDPAKAEADPDNKLYWRANRRRLEAETIRDSVLATSGRLNRALGGKPVLTPIEPEVYDLIFTEGEPDNLWPVTPDESQHRRRSLYLLNRRTVRMPFLANFDQPDTMTSCAMRPISTHALQALSLLNSDFMQDQSKAFADRVRTECGDDPGCAVEQAYHFALARQPNATERALAAEFLSGSELSDLCLALLNRNEFVYRP